MTALNDFLDGLGIPLPVAIVAAVVILIILWRMFQNVRIYLGAKGYVRKTKKLRRKKFNGLNLVEFSAKRRKKNTNSYKKLKRKSKTRVEKYFQYKEDELPGVTNYSNGKMFKRNKAKLTIFVSNGKKKVMKIKMKKATKRFIELTNKYECLDELVEFLHNLPDAILEHQEYDVYVNEHDISIGYQVK